MVPALDLALGTTIAELSAKIAGAVEAQARLTITPPTLAVSLATALQIVAQLQAAIAVGAPDIGFELTALASLIAELQVALGPLLAIEAAASGSVSAYVYEGPASGLSEIGAHIPGGNPAANTVALVLAGTTPAAHASMQTIFGVP
jgi:hypothetical protein